MGWVEEIGPMYKLAAELYSLVTAIVFCSLEIYRQFLADSSNDSVYPLCVCKVTFSRRTDVGCRRRLTAVVRLEI